MMRFADDVVRKVWEKGVPTPGNDPAAWRKDQCDAWIGWADYGNRQSQYGWEIDHIRPASEGGGDELANLRPLQWQNNAGKQAGRLVCVVKAHGINNEHI